MTYTSLNYEQHFWQGSGHGEQTRKFDWFRWSQDKFVLNKRATNIFVRSKNVCHLSCITYYYFYFKYNLSILTFRDDTRKYNSERFEVNVVVSVIVRVCSVVLRRDCCWCWLTFRQPERKPSSQEDMLCATKRQGCKFFLAHTSCLKATIFTTLHYGVLHLADYVDDNTIFS